MAWGVTREVGKSHARMAETCSVPKRCKVAAQRFLTEEGSLLLLLRNSYGLRVLTWSGVLQSVGLESGGSHFGSLQSAGPGSDA